MQSRTSFFNPGVFRKNLTRFAPVWGCYILCLILGMFLMIGDDLVYWFPAHFAGLINFMSMVNLGYGLLVAQMLFGDLYNTRMCNALHAMPLRRECWFTTHIVSGFAFSLLPTLIFTGISLPIIANFSAMEKGWQLPLYWLLANTLQYTFFFGAATFSALCTGNRMGMAIIYAIVNCFSYLTYFLLDMVYEPMLHGVILQHDIFQWLCPVANLASTQFIHCTRNRELMGYTPDGAEKYNISGTFELTDQWGYLWIIAAVGIVLMVAALVLYRRRRLECAGDVIATRKLEPVFMVLFSLTSAVVVFFITSQILGIVSDGRGMLPLFTGLAAGWFAGRMLLERQVNVFRRGKNWLGLVILAAAFALSMFLNSRDIFGFVTWMPEPEDVQQVEFGIGWRGQITSEDPQVIADALRLHELALEDMVTREDIIAEEAKAIVTTPDGDRANRDADYRRSCSFALAYRLKNGRTVERSYHLWVDSEAGKLLNRYGSTPGAVFADYPHIQTAEDLLLAADTPAKLLIQGVPVAEDLLTEETVEALFRAVIADCEAGTMTQYYEFHNTWVIQEENLHLNSYNVEVLFDKGERYYYFDIYGDSENCLAWLESLDILEEVRQVVSGYYG